MERDERELDWAEEFATWPSRTTPFDSEPEQGTAPAPASQTPEALRAVARTDTRGRAPNRLPLSDTRAVTRVAVACHAEMLAKCSREDDWHGVHFQMGVIQKLMAEEGLA